MNTYEKFVKTIKNISKEGQKVFIGEMKSESDVLVNNILITKKNLLFLDIFLGKIASEVKGTISSSGGEVHTHEFIDNSIYYEPLKKGDNVALLKVNGNKYLILGRVKTL